MTRRKAALTAELKCEPNALPVVLKLRTAMRDQANPVLVMIAAMLMAAVIFVYVVDRSIDHGRHHLSLLSTTGTSMPF
jgi:hypothetical protein